MTAIKSNFHFVGVTTNGPFSGLHMEYENQGEQDSINGIKRSFGIKGSGSNKEDWRINNIPQNLKFISSVPNNYCALIYNLSPNYFVIDGDGVTSVDFRDVLETEETLVAWDRNSFCIFSKKENEWWIKELYEAILKKDVAIFPVKGEAYLGQRDLEIIILSKY